MISKKFSPSIITAAAALFAGSAFAQSADFGALDTDASGGLSLAEVQAAVPDVTAEAFGAYDADGSGELSEAEFASWVAGEPQE